MSKELIDMMNQALSMEIQVSIQYMWQHVKIYGFDHLPVADELRKIAIEEMKHAETISERIDYLGGDPTTVPAPITLGKTPHQMIEIDKAAEEGAIDLYRKIIEKAMAERDYASVEIFQDILEDEEDHHYTFRTLLEK
ncbi:MAG: ferritin-like domain-containing protein [Candidatus Thorarchaeota archaeon]